VKWSIVSGAKNRYEGVDWLFARHGERMVEPCSVLQAV
jgi:hypothetical protein